jgi:hypothetical protein
MFVASALVLGCSSAESLPFQNRVDPDELEPTAFTLPLPCGTSFDVQPLPADVSSALILSGIDDGTPLLAMIGGDLESRIENIEETGDSLTIEQGTRIPSPEGPSYHIRYALPPGSEPDVADETPLRRGMPIATIYGKIASRDVPELDGVSLVIQVIETRLRDDGVTTDAPDPAQVIVGCVEVSES